MNPDQRVRLAWQAFQATNLVPYKPGDVYTLDDDVVCSSCGWLLPGPDMDFCPPCEALKPPSGALAA